VSVFFLRRLSFVLVIFFFVGDMAIFQAIYNMQATLYYMIYLIRFRPFEQKNMHNLELFNETCYMLFGYTVLLFNPTLSGEAMFKMGWVSIAIISFVIAVNLTITILKLLKTLFSQAKSCCCKKEAKKSQPSISKK
jgi:hypothetical protein